MISELANLSLASQLGIVFLAGIGTSLTPCVYPLIPVTLALFGASRTASTLTSFLLSITFVVGIATTFTTLGIIAASTGVVFGALLGDPIVIISLCVLLVVLALYTLDMLPLPFIHAIQAKANSLGGTGYLGAFLAGAASGFVAAPCVGPILVAILLFVTQTQDILRGALLLAVYSLGMGLLFIVLGTFSGLLKRIPRSGNWLYAVKYFMAVALFIVAIFLLQPLIPDPLRHQVASVSSKLLWLVVLLSILFGYLSYRGNNQPIRFSSALVLSLALFALFIPTPVVVTTPAAALDQKTPFVHWHSNLADALKDASRSRKPLLVDFSADWCAACKELEKHTFPDPSVIPLLSQFVLARIDFTEMSEENSKLTERFGIIGLPWIIFLQSNGSVLPSPPVTGFLGPEDFKKKIKQVLALVRNEVPLSDALKT